MGSIHLPLSTMMSKITLDSSPKSLQWVLKGFVADLAAVGISTLVAAGVKGTKIIVEIDKVKCPNSSALDFNRLICPMSRGLKKAHR